MTWKLLSTGGEINVRAYTALGHYHTDLRWKPLSIIRPKDPASIGDFYSPMHNTLVFDPAVMFT